MTWYLSRWSALGAWVAVMCGLWWVLVPAILSRSSLAVLAVAGPVLAVGVFTIKGAHEPAPSVRQGQAQAEAAATRGRR